MHVATLIASLSAIAWTLNLWGHDIPYNLVFQSYLFISLNNATLFVESAIVKPDVQEYLTSLDVEVREYNDIWSFLRRGSGGVSFVDYQKVIKNSTKNQGLHRAYVRDGAAYIRWLAWLEDKFSKGYEITEYEAAQQLTEYKRKNECAALPHYTPWKSTAK